MEITRRTRRRPRVEIVPMVDVVFFLLVFFMLFTTFRSTPAGLEVELPRAATAEERVPQQLVISVGRSGELSLQEGNAPGRLVTLNELQAAVRRAVAADPTVLVVVRGDRLARYEYVVRAIDAVRLVGGSNLALAVESPELAARPAGGTLASR
ncbi:MAG TPA: biopolymer transporter ExbD [Limnochordia bacterium]